MKNIRCQQIGWNGFSCVRCCANKNHIACSLKNRCEKSEARYDWKLQFAISLRGSGKMKLETKQRTEITPKCTKETRILIWNNVAGTSKLRPNVMKEEVCVLGSKGSLMARKENGHLRKMIDHYPNNIMFPKGGRKTTQNFHENIFPRMGGRW